MTLVVAHGLAFAQNLRRYTVGYDGEIQYWKHPQWSPPISPLVLTIAYALLVTAFFGWYLFAIEAPERAREPGEALPSSVSRTAPGTT